MQNYFLTLNLENLASQLKTCDHARMIALIVVKFVDSNIEIPDTVESCTANHTQLALETMKSQDFRIKFEEVC
jgi:hypothetical protein